MWTCQWTGKPVELCIHVQLSQLAALKIWNWNKSITVSCGTRAGVLSTLRSTEHGVVVFWSWSDVQWCSAMHTTIWRKYPVVGAVVNDEWKLATVQWAWLYPQLQSKHSVITVLLHEWSVTVIQCLQLHLWLWRKDFFIRLLHCHEQNVRFSDCNIRALKYEQNGTGHWWLSLPLLTVASQESGRRKHWSTSIKMVTEMVVVVSSKSVQRWPFLANFVLSKIKQGRETPTNWKRILNRNEEIPVSVHDWKLTHTLE